MGPAYRFRGGSHVLEGGAWNQTPLAMFPESSNPTLILRILLGCKATQRFLEFPSRSLSWLKPPATNSFEAGLHQAELESLAQTKAALHQSCDFVGGPGNSDSEGV